MNKMYSILILPISMGIFWLHAAQPTESIKIHQSVAKVFNRMVKESLDESDKHSGSDIYQTLEKIDDDGIIELGKKSNIVTLTEAYQQTIPKNPYVATILEITAKSGPSANERILAWRSIRGLQWVALQDEARKKIPDLSLSLNITDIITQNSTLKLNKEQKQILLATQLFVAAEMVKLQEVDPGSFNKMFEVDDDDGGCTIL